MKSKLSKFSMHIKIAVFVLLLLSLIAAIIVNIQFERERTSSLIFANPPEENQIFKKFVYISGEVKNPGVYEFNKEARLVEIIELAGGFTDNADLEFVNKELNLSKIIEDQDQIFIPSKKSNTASGSVKSATGLINLNTATQEQLESLPGIGAATAKKIMDNRPFNSIDQLLNVSGIGESKYRQIKDLVTI